MNYANDETINLVIRRTNKSIIILPVVPQHIKKTGSRGDPPSRVMRFFRYLTQTSYIKNIRQALKTLALQAKSTRLCAFSQVLYQQHRQFRQKALQQFLYFSLSQKPPLSHACGKQYHEKPYRLYVTDIRKLVDCRIEQFSDTSVIVGFPLLHRQKHIP